MRSSPCPCDPGEQHFTVVQWDHRGAGKTLGRTGKANSGEMTFDRRVDDAIEVIEFLRQQLGVDKVVVLAESMGTLTGLPLAMRRPDLVAALVVTDLYVNMAANEARKYQLTLERLQAAGNPKNVVTLERIGPDPTRWDLRAWNTNMAWAFRTNVPTPNLDRRLLFPLALRIASWGGMRLRLAKFLAISGTGPVWWLVPAGVLTRQFL